MSEQLYVINPTANYPNYCFSSDIVSREQLLNDAADDVMAYKDKHGMKVRDKRLRRYIKIMTDPQYYQYDKLIRQTMPCLIREKEQRKKEIEILKQKGLHCNDTDWIDDSCRRVKLINPVEPALLLVDKGQCYGVTIAPIQISFDRIMPSWNVVYISCRTGKVFY